MPAGLSLFSNCYFGLHQNFPMMIHLTFFEFLIFLAGTTLAPIPALVNSLPPVLRAFYSVPVTVHGLTTLDLQAMSFPDSAKIKAF